MTEEEAKTKWCPHKRIDSYEGNSNYNIHSNGGMAVVTNCIASDCMMWVADIDVTYKMEQATYKTLDSGRCGLVK